MSDYVIERATIGHLRQEEVDVVRMPRARFLEIVDGLLADPEFSGLREELRPIAETMPSFPLSDWIDKDRGCGCVVGEYLVARSELDRAQLAQLAGQRASFKIDALLAENPQGMELEDFGYAIDDGIKDEIDPEGWRNPMPDAVLIVDDPS